MTRDDVREAVTIGRRWREARLVTTSPLVAGLCEITIEVDTWPGHLAGQHVDIRVPGAGRWDRPHSYSIANAPGTGGTPATWLRLAVPAELHGLLLQGAGLEVEGPKGDRMAWLPEQTGDRPLLLIAGGSGIVPLLAIACAWAAHPGPAPLRLIHSVRSRWQQPYNEEVALLEIECGARVTSVVTRSGTRSYGEARGRISRRDLELFGFPATRNPECFVCGPGAFVESVAEMLLQCGHPASSIRTEWAIGTIGAAA